jgi:hypothetical protein
MLRMSSVIASAKFLDRKAEGGGGRGGGWGVKHLVTAYVRSPVT